MSLSREEDSCDGQIKNDGWSEEEDECLAQLWEDCFDISELIEKTTKRVRRYEEVLIQRNDKSDEMLTCVKLTTSIAEGLRSLGFDIVMQRLQSVVFSTEKQEKMD